MDMNKKSELSFSADNFENEKCEGDKNEKIIITDEFEESNDFSKINLMKLNKTLK